jgi:hypothetical protein
VLVLLGSVGPGRTQPERGRKFVLLVGVRKYESGKFNELRFTENDVEALARILGGRGGFTSVRVLSTSRGQKQEKDAPTASNFHREMKELLAKKKGTDTILVALAGHGIQVSVKGKDESFFCPADAQLNDKSTLISLGTLFTDLDECGAGVKLLLVDACRNDPAAGRNVDIDTLPRLPRGSAALFSCKSGERAFESDKLGGGHGVFFHHVIEGLKGEAKNKRGEVTWGQLAEYVTEAVSDEVPKLIGGGARQTPELKVNLTGKSPVLIGPESVSRPTTGDVRAILTRAIEAHGGEAALTKYKARKFKGKGKMTLDGGMEVNVTLQVSSMPPDRLKETIDMEIAGTSIRTMSLQDGASISVEANGMAVPLSDAVKKSMAEECHLAEIQRLVPLVREKKYKLAAAAAIQVEGKPAVGVRVSAPGHKDVLLYFDKETGRLVKYERRAFNTSTEKEYTEEQITLAYGERRSNGLLVPRKLLLKHDGKRFVEIEVEKADYFEKLNDSEFKK